MMTFKTVLLIVLVYLMLYAIVDRICKCAENVALSKSYKKFLETQEGLKEQHE